MSHAASPDERLSKRLTVSLKRPQFGEGRATDGSSSTRLLVHRETMKIARTAARWFSSCPGRETSASLRSALRKGAPIDVHPEVKDALDSEKPVVALETAITTHGLPYPANRDTSLSLERIVRSTGSIPATIGLIGGRVKIGLEPAELQRLADPAHNGTTVKISRRDIAAAVATKRDGGTTVSSTLIFAALAGIKVVATGGYGFTSTTR
jgi:pseudouridylate synthase / pseudouridine kinase